MRFKRGKRQLGNGLLCGINLNFREKGQLARLNQSFETSLLGISVPLRFALGISGNFVRLVRISEIQQFADFRKTHKSQEISVHLPLV